MQHDQRCLGPHNSRSARPRKDRGRDCPNCAPTSKRRDDVTASERKGRACTYDDSPPVNRRAATMSVAAQQEEEDDDDGEEEEAPLIISDGVRKAEHLSHRRHGGHHGTATHRTSDRRKNQASGHERSQCADYTRDSWRAEPTAAIAPDETAQTRAKRDCRRETPSAAGNNKPSVSHLVNRRDLPTTADDIRVAGDAKAHKDACSNRRRACRDKSDKDKRKQASTHQEGESCRHRRRDEPMPRDIAGADASASVPQQRKTRESPCLPLPLQSTVRTTESLLAEALAFVTGPLTPTRQSGKTEARASTRIVWALGRVRQQQSHPPDKGMGGQTQDGIDGVHLPPEVAYMRALYNRLASSGSRTPIPGSPARSTNHGSVTLTSSARVGARHEALSPRTTEAPTERMRAANNLLKSILLGRYVPRRRDVMDLGCGRGQDVAKLEYVKPRRVLFVDVAERALREAERRWSRAGAASFAAAFVHADFCAPDFLADLAITYYAHPSNTNNGNGDSRRSSDSAPPSPLRSPTIVAAAAPSLFPDEVVSTDDGGRGIVDVVSCQFAAHHAFYSAASAERFVASVSRALRPRGVFLGTAPAGEVVRQLLDRTPPGRRHRSGQLSLWRSEDGTDSPVSGGFGVVGGSGLAYQFHLGGDAPPAGSADEKEEGNREYTMSTVDFAIMCARHGFTRIMCAPMGSLYSEETLNPKNEDLARRMGLLVDGPTPEDIANMNLYAAFVFVKTGEAASLPSFATATDVAASRHSPGLYRPPAAKRRDAKTPDIRNRRARPADRQRALNINIDLDTDDDYDNNNNNNSDVKAQHTSMTKMGSPVNTVAANADGVALPVGDTSVRRHKGSRPSRGSVVTPEHTKDITLLSWPRVGNTDREDESKDENENESSHGDDNIASVGPSSPARSDEAPAYAALLPSI